MDQASTNEDLQNEILLLREELQEEKKKYLAASKIENLYQLISRSISDIVWIFDIVEAKFVYVSPSVEKMQGFDQEEFLRMSISEFMPLSYQEKMQNDIQERASIFVEKNEKIEYRDEFKLYRKDKTIIWAEIKSFYQYNTSSGRLEVFGVTRDITEQKKKEIQLEESTEKYRLLSQLAREGVGIYREDVFFEVNKAFCEIFGYEAKEFLNMNVLDLIFSSHSVKVVRENMRKGSSGINIYEAKTKTNDQIWVEINSRSFLYKNEKACVVTVRDVTQYRKIEQALRQNEERFRDFANSVTDPYFALDKDLNYIFWNKAYEKFLGKQSKGAMHKNWYAFDLNKGYEWIAEKYKEIIKSNKSDSFEASYGIAPKICYYMVNVYPTQRGLVVYLQNITEQKSAEYSLRMQNVEYEAINEELKQTNEELNITKEKFQQLAENSTAIIYKISLKPFVKIDYVNPAIEKITGYTQEEFYSDPAIGRKLFHPEDRSYLDEIRIKSKGDPIQCRWVHKNGRVIWIEKRNVHLCDKEGNPIALEGSARDITTQKEYELRLEKKQKELICEKERAEESDQLKTAFLNNMSHEIRTPMNGIIGFSEMLIDPNKTNEQRQLYTKIIIKSSRQLLNIVNDVLDIARIEAGQIKVNAEAVDLLEFFKNAAQYYSNEAREKNIGFEVKAVPMCKYGFILCDRKKLGQIVKHLFSNAIKFTEKGQIGFSCDVKDGYIEFSVSDTGIGIEEKLHNKIFDRFRQAELTTTRNYGGAGLGLSICKGLVELMNGKIWVKSEVGKGSEFFFTIPYTPVIESEIKYDAVGRGDENYSGSKVLIAEDESINALYMSEILLTLNIDPVFARNGFEAVELVKKQGEFKLILMDIKMPLMNGYEATREIRKLDQQVPIIGITAYALTEDKTKVLSAGCTDLLYPTVFKLLHILVTASSIAILTGSVILRLKNSLIKFNPLLNTLY